LPVVFPSNSDRLFDPAMKELEIFWVLAYWKTRFLQIDIRNLVDAVFSYRNFVILLREIDPLI
jgi:hypothetical protein